MSSIGTLRLQREGSVRGQIGPGLKHAIGLVTSLCNNAHLRNDAGNWSIEGDPMEGALLALAGKLGACWTDRPQPLAVLPFDAVWRYMAVLHEQDNGRVILLKGAPEQVAAFCSCEASAQGARPLRLAWWHAQGDAIASEGCSGFPFTALV